MPRPDTPSKADLTFIVGNPRSRQNLSRIRAHASRATKRAQDESEDIKVPKPPSPTSTDPKNTTHRHPTDQRRQSQPDVDSSVPRHRPWTPDSQAVRPESTGRDTTENVSRYTESSLSNKESPAVSSSGNSSTLLALPPYPTAHHFSTQGTTIGTWWELYPDAQASAGSSHHFDPHKRSRLVCAEDDEQSSESRRGSGSDVRLDACESEQSYSDQQPSTTSVSNQHAQHAHKQSEKERPKTVKKMAESSKARKIAQHKMQRRWRVGIAPAKALTFPPDHTYTQFETILQQTSNFYHSTFETVWQPLLRQNSAAFDVQSDFEMFSASMRSAAALLEAGQPAKAAYVVGCIVEMLIHLMHANHPQVYYMFVSLALETSSTALGQLRSKMREHLTPVCERTLGRDHPISVALRLQVEPRSRKQVRAAVMRRVHDLHQQTFGPDAYQTLAHQFVFARALSEIGQNDEALDMYSSLIKAEERILGMNTLLLVYTLFDKAMTYLAGTPPDTSIVPELHLSDALRRLQIISQEVDKLPEDSTDAEKMEVAIIHCKIVGMRILGRLHYLRKNFGTAIQFYNQAVDFGMTTLGPHAVPVHLAQSDLEHTKLEELRTSMDAFSLANADGKDVPQESDTEYHVAKTAVGEIRSSNRNYMGESSHEIPAHKGMVLGYTVVGMPTMCHTPVL